MGIWKRIFALILALGFVIPLSSVEVSAVETEATADAVLLEELATDYVTKYIENIYLYESNDLTEHTIKAAVPETSAEGSLSVEAEQMINIVEENVSITDLEENISFFEDTAEYYGYLGSAQGVTVHDFSLLTTICDTHIEGSYGYVHLYAEASFIYEGENMPSAAGDNYVVEFVKLNGVWCIVDVAAEFLEAYGVTKENFDLAAEIAEVDVAIANMEMVEQRESDIAEPNAAANLTTYYYSRNNAVAYANVYTTSTWNNQGEGDSDDFLNGNFEEHEADHSQRLKSWGSGEPEAPARHTSEQMASRGRSVKLMCFSLNLTDKGAKHAS